MWNLEKHRWLVKTEESFIWRFFERLFLVEKDFVSNRLGKSCCCNFLQFYFRSVFCLSFVPSKVACLWYWQQKYSLGAILKHIVTIGFWSKISRMSQIWSQGLTSCQISNRIFYIFCLKIHLSKKSNLENAGHQQKNTFWHILLSENVNWWTFCAS